MRRILLLVGLPLLLIVIWRIGSTPGPTTNATVEIDTNKVTELRGAVISRLAGVGAVKVGEATKYDDGNSELRFKVPTARLEEALAELNNVGGQVTSQQVDLTSADQEAQSVSDQLSGIEGCFGKVAGSLSSLDHQSRDELARCQEKLRKVNSSFDSATTDLQTTELRVTLHSHDPITWWLTLAVVLFVIALAIMGLTTWRSIRTDRMIDLSDKEAAAPRDELYLRRN